MGVDCRFSRRVSRGVPAAWVVLKAVLIVFTCLLMKSLDLGYRGNDVIWSICGLCMNLAKSADKKAVLFLVKMCLKINLYSTYYNQAMPFLKHFTI